MRLRHDLCEGLQQRSFDAPHRPVLSYRASKIPHRDSAPAKPRPLEPPGRSPPLPWGLTPWQKNVDNSIDRQLNPKGHRRSDVRQNSRTGQRLFAAKQGSDAANGVRKGAAEQRQRNGRTILAKRAKATVMTGLVRKQNWKAARWFVKTSAVVLQNHCGAFCKPLRWFPVPMRISARSPAHLRPFGCASKPILTRIPTNFGAQGYPSEWVSASVQTSRAIRRESERKLPS